MLGLSGISLVANQSTLQVKECYKETFALLDRMEYQIDFSKVALALQILDDVVFSDSDATREEVIERLKNLRVDPIFDANTQLGKHTGSVLDILFILYVKRKEACDYIFSLEHKEKIFKFLKIVCKNEKVNGLNLVQFFTTCKAEMDRLYIIFTLLKEASFKQSEVQKQFLNDCKFDQKSHRFQGNSFDGTSKLVKQAYNFLHKKKWRDGTLQLGKKLLKNYIFNYEYSWFYSDDGTNIPTNIQDYMFILEYFYTGEVLSMLYGITYVESQYLNKPNPQNTSFAGFDNAFRVKALVSILKEELKIEVSPKVKRLIKEIEA